MSSRRFATMLSHLKQGKMIEVQNLEGAPPESWVVSRIINLDYDVSKMSSDLVHSVSIVPLSPHVEATSFGIKADLSYCRPLQPTQLDFLPVIGQKVEIYSNFSWIQGTVIEVIESSVTVQALNGNEKQSLRLPLEVRQIKIWQEGTGLWLPKYQEAVVVQPQPQAQSDQETQVVQPQPQPQADGRRYARGARKTQRRRLNL